MQRPEKEIINTDEIHAIIKKCKFCRIAFSYENKPYIIPVCFGFEPNFLYFHCAPNGRKIEILRENPNVCFQMDCDTEMAASDNACNWGVIFKSIIGFGVAEIIRDANRKKEILSIIMRKYSDASHYELSEASLLKTCVVQISITSMTGKKSDEA